MFYNLGAEVQYIISYVREYILIINVIYTPGKEGCQLAYKKLQLTLNNRTNQQIYLYTV